ncbi:MAG: hypothetical protein KatS3mg082_3449 [Nitrospiraceae bacterium]|nr:MAG: hypothetical protein KatS3mg082_3449 [Nitrospiraceae bacterium]
MHLETTKHAVERFAQRGFMLDDAEIIMQLGTEVEDGFLVCDRECRQVEEQLRAILRRLDRLRGARLVVEGSTVVTVYRAGKRKQKQLLKSLR